MAHYKINAKKDEGQCLANTLLHNHAIKRLKAKIQQALKLDAAHPILVSLIVQHKKIETLIMIECCQSDRMKIYSIKKAPDEIEDAEILGLEEKKAKHRLYPLYVQRI
jgi:hypothetical protein